jgi:TonB family protein
MGYQALLFCPDEKTARTVTQVLSELEFSVESCIEPFAAVKKLMGQHFDAVVVDCDNEQNATLLFKSARNSTSNQASLAVAVVEGQAGVAKAFRIGANLVLTKPINIEQAKGTLRVARGLLRKGDPAKPVASAPAAAPAKPPVAAKPVPPAKSAGPPVPAAISTPVPSAPPEVKPPATPAWPATAMASPTPVSAPVANDDDLLDIGADDSIASPSPAAVVESALGKTSSPDSQAAVLPAVAASPAAGAKSFSPVVPATHASGAASAPAPAREVPNSHVAEVSPARIPAPAELPLARPTEAGSTESSTYAGSAPSFTFGGANVPEKSGGGSKKIILGAAAAAIVAAALYVGWTKSQGSKASPESPQTQAAPAPVAAPQIVKPSANPSAPVSPKTSAAAPYASETFTNAHVEATPAKKPAVSTPDSALENDVTVTNLPKSTGSTSGAESKGAEEPRVLKAGSAPAVHAKPAVPDAPAPSMIGIATAGSAPPPDLGSSEGSAPQPVLQTVNVSQGVSQGLLLKKVAPTYPRNALFMRIEGTVELVATISKTGDISHVAVVSGDSQLTRAASDAVKQWKYKPYMLNGQPVEIQTHVTINFKLPK